VILDEHSVEMEEAETQPTTTH